MKKLRLGLIIAATTLSLVGCGSKTTSELETVQKNLDQANATIQVTMQVSEAKIEELSNKLDEQIEELSSKMEETKADEVIIQSYNSGVNVSIEDKVEYVGKYGDYNKVIEHYKTIAEAQGKKLIYPEQSYGDRIFVLGTTEKIKNITLSWFGKEFIDKFNCNVVKYFEENEIEVNGNVVKELNPDEILVFTAHESEGIPSTYFSWVEPDGRVIYHTVSFSGR